MAHANKSLDVANDKIRQLEMDLKRKSEELDGVKSIRTSKTKALQIENDKPGCFFEIFKTTEPISKILTQLENYKSI